MPISSDDWGREEMISHARGLSYYTLREMEASIERAQKLWNRELPAFDKLYLLQIIDYGDLQRQYKGLNYEPTFDC